MLTKIKGILAGIAGVMGFIMALLFLSIIGLAVAFIGSFAILGFIGIVIAFFIYFLIYEAVREWSQSK